MITETQAKTLKYNDRLWIVYYDAIAQCERKKEVYFRSAHINYLIIADREETISGYGYGTSYCYLTEPKREYVGYGDYRWKEAQSAHKEC